MTVASVVDAGQDALARGAWQEAAASFGEAAAETGAPEAHEGLSEASWWLDDGDGTIAAREAAVRGYEAAGDRCGAARMALWLASDHLEFRGDDAVATAWLRRARRLLEGAGECAETGWVALVEADMALLVHHDPARACALAADAVALGVRLGRRDIEAVGLAILGWASVVTGAADEGRRALEDAASLALAGDLGDLVATGWVLCHVVTASADIGDFACASQWCRTLDAYAQRWAGRHFRGICRSAYGCVLTVAGDWEGAETELTTAVRDLAAARPALAPIGSLRLAELRARQGRLDEARALFEAARPHPMALVGLGTLDLDAGDLASATDAAERVLRNLSPEQLLDRVPTLELLVCARAAGGDHAAAQEALRELRDVAQRLGTPYLRARASLSAARCALAARDHDGARCAAEDAADGFARCGAPYDAAMARLALADALDGLARGEAAAVERTAARVELERLGATRDAQRAQAAPRGGLGELTERELDVLRLVAQGLSDAQIAERLVLSPHTVHRHVANVRTKLRLPSRAAAVAFAAREGLL